MTVSHDVQPTVDCHAHIMPAGYIEALEEVSRREGGAAEMAHRRLTRDIHTNLPASTARHMVGHLADRLPLMDKAEVDIQVISAGSSLAFAAQTGSHRELVAAWNDAVHDELQPLADRFRVFAASPFPDVEGVLAEVRRVAQRGSTVGFLMNSHIGGIPLVDGRWEAVFDLWNEMGAVVFCHPDGFRCGEFTPRYLRVDVGTQFEDTLTALQLIEGGVARRYPRIRWIVPHLGGTLPFVIGRVDEHWERDRVRRQTPERPSALLDNIWFDTGGHDVFSVRIAFERFTVDRFVLGTDFPMVEPDNMKARVGQVSEALSDDSDVRTVLSSNSIELLGLT